LQNRPIIGRSLLTIVTPYSSRSHRVSGINHLRQLTATHYNTLQHPATLCNTLQHTHTTTHSNTLQHTATHSNSHYSSRSHPTTSDQRRRPSMSAHCNTLQHCDTATPCIQSKNGSCGKSARSRFLFESLYYTYGVATISRLLKIVGLFCKRAL